MSELEQLQDADFTRVLVVVAHPDDAEYGTSAAVAKWVEQGADVGYLLLTAGEAGMKSPPAEVAPLRRAEQRAACDVVGVNHLTILDHPDGLLEPDLNLRRSIAREIRLFRPDVVVCTTWELEAGFGLNHADHRAVGLATVDAIRDADNPWLFTDLADEGMAPWGVTWLLVGAHSRPTHAVPISEGQLAKAVASLEAHEAYLADLPNHPAPKDFIPTLLSGAGEQLGTAHAMAYAAFKLR